MCPELCQPHICYQSWAFTAADDNARCGLGRVHESRHALLTMSPRQVLRLAALRARLYKFRLKCYWLIMLFVSPGFQLSFESL